MIGHKPECPANWGVGEMPDKPCTFCEMLRACEQRVLDAAREAVEALRGCLGTDDNGDGTVWVEKADALDAIEGLREKS